MHIVGYHKHLIVFPKDVKWNWSSAGVILPDSLFESEWFLNLVRVDCLLSSEFLSSPDQDIFRAFFSASSVVLFAHFDPMN